MSTIKNLIMTIIILLNNLIVKIQKENNKKEIYKELSVSPQEL